jgi:hypothetical protein
MSTNILTDSDGYVFRLADIGPNRFSFAPINSPTIYTGLRVVLSYEFADCLRIKIVLGWAVPDEKPWRSTRNSLNVRRCIPELHTQARYWRRKKS